MKQLLIVNSAKALNAGAAAPTDLSGLQEGAIAFWELGESKFLSAAPTKKFGIALGRPNNAPAFVIPEVDINSLEITVTAPSAGSKYKGEITIPTVTEKQVITLVLVKKGAVPHERNTWTATETVKAGDTATTVANRLYNRYKAMADSGSLNIIATISGAKITITATDETDYVLKNADDLTTAPTNTSAVKEIGGKAFIADLASRCAAGKGFNLLSEDGKEIYPGYPETVEDLIPNASGADGASTTGYAVFNLHFGTIREAGKQLNERVYQYVHIAVPITNSSYSTIATILGNPVLVNESE